MKSFARRGWALIVLLVAILFGAFIPVAHAADGDAKITVVDKGTTGGGSTVVLECTTSNSPCALVVHNNRFYEFTLTEESWDPVYTLDMAAYKDATSTDLAAEWPTAYRTHDELWEEPTCDSSDFSHSSSSVWWGSNIFCGNGNNGSYYLILKGRATLSTNGYIAGYLRKGYNGAQKFVTVNYAATN